MGFSTSGCLSLNSGFDVTIRLEKSEEILFDIHFDTLIFDIKS